MDDVVSITTTELLRKELCVEYGSDVFIKAVINRTKKSRIRRTIWNLIYWYVLRHQHGVLSDMLFAAYRMGVVDARFDPFAAEWKQA